MDVGFPVDPKKLKEFNFIRYKGVQPSWDLIKNVIEKSKLKRMYKFERVWGMAKSSLRLYKNGHRDLPATYWHIFYDFDTVNQKYIKKRRVTKKSAKLRTDKNVSLPNKQHIDEFKNRQPAGR